MKKILLMLSITFCLMTAKAVAQGGFGGVHLKSDFNTNGSQLLLGGGGAWLLTDAFYLGGAGFGAINSIRIGAEEMNSFGYGGFLIGYLPSVSEETRIGLDVLSGSGGITLNETEDDFFFIEPQLLASYQLNEFSALSLGLYYRFVFIAADAQIENSDLSNIGLKLVLNFGKF